MTPWTFRVWQEIVCGYEKLGCELGTVTTFVPSATTFTSYHGTISHGSPSATLRPFSKPYPTAHNIKSPG